MIGYRLLFQVDIEHDYFLSRGNVVFEAQPDADRAALAELWSVPGVLEVVPDKAAAATLAGHKMIFRSTRSGFMVAVQRDLAASDVQPSVPLSPDFRLSLALHLKDPQFANYTELGAVGSGFYRFGNDSQNRVAATNFLSRPVAPFDVTRRYVAGDTYSQPAGATFDLFLALRDTGPSATPAASDWRRTPADTFDPVATYQAGAIVLAANGVFRARIDSPGADLENATEWETVAALANQYVTAADGIFPAAGNVDIDIGELALVQATIRLFRPGESVAAVEQTFVSAEGVLERIRVDLRATRSGRYRMEVVDGAGAVVPGRGFPVYVAADPATARGFGVIEIARGSGDFALLNTDGTLRSPRYVLRFLNRATRWRYVFPASQPVGAGADVAVEAGDNRILVTAAPRPLTRFGSRTRLQADSAATSPTSEEILLPVPDVKRVRRENAQWYSETHVANLTIGP